MAADLALRGLSAATCEAYLRYAQKFVAYHKRSPHELGVEHVRTWVLHLLQAQGRNPNTVNVCISALRFLFGTTLERPEVMASVRVVRTRSRQPDVPSGSQVAALLAHARNAKDRAMFMLLYGAGLRVSEMLALVAGDIDSTRMVIHVRDTKNRHDRIVPLPPAALEALRTYWRESRPKGKLLFASPFRAARGHALSRVAVHKRCNGPPSARASSSTSIPISCAMRSRRTCWRSAPTCAPCRSCWDIGRSTARPATRTSRRRDARRSAAR